MCQYSSNKKTPSQEFSYGYNDIPETQQMIAFWTHTIDTFASILEHDENIYVNHIARTTLQSCGVNDTYGYMGGVRAGFHKSIQALPTEIKGPVEKYFQERTNKMKTIVPDDVCEVDFMFGTGDPFKYD